MTPLPHRQQRDDFARTVLDIAAQVEAAEAQLKDLLIDAAKSGDMDRVVALVTAWKSCPAEEVLAHNGPTSP